MLVQMELRDDNDDRISLGKDAVQLFLLVDTGTFNHV